MILPSFCLLSPVIIQRFYCARRKEFQPYERITYNEVSIHSFGLQFHSILEISNKKIQKCCRTAQSTPNPTIYLISVWHAARTDNANYGEEILFCLSLIKCTYLIARADCIVCSHRSSKSVIVITGTA